MTSADWLAPGHTTGRIYCPKERLPASTRAVALGVLAVITFWVCFGVYEALVAIGRAL